MVQPSVPEGRGKKLPPYSKNEKTDSLPQKGCMACPHPGQQEGCDTLGALTARAPPSSADVVSSKRLLIYYYYFFSSKVKTIKILPLYLTVEIRIKYSHHAGRC